MAVLTSLVPAVIDALVAKAKSLGGLVDIPVLYHVPDEPQQYVGFGAVDPWDQRLVTMPGTVFREETFTVHGEIVVRVPGDDAVGARDRAFLILTQLETAL